MYPFPTQVTVTKKTLNMRTIFTLVLGIIICSSSHNSYDSKKLITDFYNAIFDIEKSDEQIINKYLRVDPILYNDDLFRKSLSNVFEMLREKVENPSDINILSYDEAESQQVKGFYKITEEKKTAEVYFLIHNGEILLPLKICKNKICSLTVMQKGYLRYFVSYN